MYLLDTDTVSNYLDKRRMNPELRARIEGEPPESIWISVVTIEEIVRGVLEVLARARKHPRNPARIIACYAWLHNAVRDLSLFQALLYTEQAEAIYKNIPASLRQRHSQDCQITAIALERGYSVVTSNTADFEKTGVQCVNWNVHPETAE